MVILSHRGFWVEPSEKNTIKAFERSFEFGFGTETDVRDLNGTLVISHDMPNTESQVIFLEDFFSLYKTFKNNLPLALNIKSDGLQTPLSALLCKYDIQNYFLFDMSVPDAIGYIDRDMICFTRQSEFEMNPSFYDQSHGVWLDEFENHWISTSAIKEHIDSNKAVCIVSPELHSRQYLPTWEEYKNTFATNKDFQNIMICTDLPIEANSFFNEN